MHSSPIDNSVAYRSWEEKILCKTSEIRPCYILYTVIYIGYCPSGEGTGGPIVRQLHEAKQCRSDRNNASFCNPITLTHTGPRKEQHTARQNQEKIIFHVVPHRAASPGRRVVGKKSPSDLHSSVVSGVKKTAS